MKDDGGPAFPVTRTENVAPNDLGAVMAEVEHYGLSVRDWFAGMALQGYNANPEQCAQMTHEQTAACAFRDADAMLQARKENQ